MKNALNASPEAPAGLTDEGKALWVDICAGWDLSASPDSLRILESACRCWAIFRQAEAQLAKDGLFQRDRYRQLRPHCAVDVMRRAHAQFLQAMKGLGLETQAEERSRMRGPGRPGRPARGY